MRRVEVVWSIPTNSEEKRSSHWNTQESCWTWQGGVSRTRGQSRNEGVYHPKMRWQGKSSPRGEWIFGLLKLFQEDGFILRGAGIEDNDVCMGKWSWSTVWRRRLEGRSFLRFLQYVLVKPTAINLNLAQEAEFWVWLYSLSPIHTLTDCWKWGCVFSKPRGLKLTQKPYIKNCEWFLRRWYFCRLFLNILKLLPLLMSVECFF